MDSELLRNFVVKIRTPGLASWRKMTQPGEFFGDDSFRGCPVRAHFPRNETLDSLSTLSS